MPNRVGPDLGTPNLRTSFVEAFNIANIPLLPTQFTIDGKTKPIVYQAVSANANLDGSVDSSGNPTIQIGETVATGQERASGIIFGIVIEFKKLIAKLKKAHGEPALPPARGPFELVMWENACYLLPDERRALVFEGLREQVGMDAESIWKADQAVLLPLARMGGMRPETRVFRWREIARITLTQFDGDLDTILQLPYEKARRALHQFPNVGQPGAEKILMLCGKSAGLPLESNGLRVLVRVGYGREQKNYGATYRSVQEALEGQMPHDAAALTRAHMLLRYHGKTVCRNNGPHCEACTLVTECAFAAKQV